MPTLVVQNGNVALRISGPADRIGTDVRAAIQAIDKDLAIPAIQPLATVLERRSGCGNRTRCC